MPELKFDSIAHIYTVGDRQIPSVTQILSEFVRVDIGSGWYVSTFTGQIIDAATFEAAGAMGTAIHKMIHYYLDNDLDEGTLSPALIAVLMRFKEWEKVFSPKIELAETMLYSERYGFAGTMDCVCTIGRDHWIVDWKSGGYSTAGPQLAAYEKLYQELSGSRTPLKRAVLHLPKDGSPFKWVPQTSREDWKFFEARLYQNNYLKGR